MYKNVATKVSLFAFDTTTGAAKTGDAANITAYVSKDWGAVTVLADTSATEMDATNAKGWYLFDVAQAESNADVLLFSGKSSTANVSVVGMRIDTVPVSNIKTNTALPAFEILMTDSTTHNPATGLTVTVTRSIDGGAFGAGTLGAVTAVSNGIYKFDFAAGDLNGKVITLRATATGADDLFVTIVTDA